MCGVAASQDAPGRVERLPAAHGWLHDDGDDGLGWAAEGCAAAAAAAALCGLAADVSAVSCVLGPIGQYDVTSTWLDATGATILEYTIRLCNA